MARERSCALNDRCLFHFASLDSNASVVRPRTAKISAVRHNRINIIPPPVRPQPCLKSTFGKIPEDRSPSKTIAPDNTIVASLTYVWSASQYLSAAL
jgi:hypothetical protein